MTILPILADSAARQPSAQYTMDWGTAFFFGGLLFALIGGVIGFLLWRSAKGVAARIEDENNKIQARYDELDRETTKLKNEITEVTVEEKVIEKV
ncbi:MAG: hypothetical protein AAF226_12110 [Verrucomicrobiota bacterium]